MMSDSQIKAENEILRLNGLLRVANNEIHDAQNLRRDLRAEIAEERRNRINNHNMHQEAWRIVKATEARAEKAEANNRILHHGMRLILAKLEPISKTDTELEIALIVANALHTITP